jgi:site-specific recombinase
LFITKAYNNIGTYGISFKAHQHLTLIEQLLLRLETVLNFLVVDDKINSKKKLINIFYKILEFETSKNKIREYISKSTQNIAREITESTGSKGESYITLTKKEYISMLKSALGGGFLVAFACFIKMNMGSVTTSLFGKAFMYSINYIWVFTSIYLLNFTLATKQPAMTASTLAIAIESGLVKDDNFQGLTILISRIWRTQFIAFVGNVLMASITALGIMFAWQYLFNTNPAEKKAYTLINDLNFVYSPLIFHAAIAGFFLFISGLISGYTSKRTKFNNLVGRIQNHPILKQLFTYNTRMNIADYLNKHIAGIVSNFWFGIFMGSTVVLGMFLGLNLDIRHITFAAGNFMLAFFGQNFTTTSYDILMSLLGIGIIGFINFIVSFTLSLLLALRSRGIEFNSLKLIFSSSLSYFFKNPMSFFFPVEKFEPHKTN